MILLPQKKKEKLNPTPFEKGENKMHATLLSHWLSKKKIPNYVPPQFFPTLVPHSMSKDIYLSYIKKTLVILANYLP
jgi:hypothetical protein